jgi:membrane-bound lytic murein transglycosylase B
MLSVVGMYCLTVWAASEAPDPELQQFIVEMSEKHGFDAGSLERLLGKARLSTSVLRAMTRPAEAKPWEEYRALFVNEERVERGLQFWDRHADVLASARTAYGVSESVVTAIIGVESGYGRNTGRFRVLDALFTLAFNHTERPEQFRRELESFLLLAREKTSLIEPERLLRETIGPRSSYPRAAGSSP